MNKQDVNKINYPEASLEEFFRLKTEIAELKRSLQQKEKKIVFIKEKMDILNKKNKSISHKLKRSKTREKELKTTLVEEQKKNS